MSTHTQSSYVRHAISHPSNRLVVTAPRQSGVSYAIAHDAIQCACGGDKVAIITQDACNIKETKQKLKSISPNTRDVIVVSGVKYNEYGVACLGDIPMHKFSCIYVDLAGWSKWTNTIIQLVAEHQRLVLGTTGSNTDVWLRRVAELTECGFTSIFVNVPRHYGFKKQYVADLGQAFYDREFKVNTGANYGESQSVTKDGLLQR